MVKKPKKECVQLCRTSSKFGLFLLRARAAYAARALIKYCRRHARRSMLIDPTHPPSGGDKYSLEDGCGPAAPGIQ